MSELNVGSPDPSAESQRRQIGETFIRPDGLAVTIFATDHEVQQLVGGVGASYTPEEVNYLGRGVTEIGYGRLIQDGMQRPGDNLGQAPRSVRSFEDEINDGLGAPIR